MASWSNTAGSEQMRRSKPSGTTQSGLAVVHANAATIDIGATLQMAAVGEDRSAEPVRSFGTAG